MPEIMILGDEETVAGFGALGLESVAAADTEQAQQALKAVLEADVALLCVTEALAHTLENELRPLMRRGTPAVLLIPGASGNTGQGRRQMDESIRRAVGASLWEDEGSADDR